MLPSWQQFLKFVWEWKHKGGIKINPQIKTPEKKYILHINDFISYGTVTQEN